MHLVRVLEVIEHLSDLCLMVYTKRFSHDMKLMYVEFGLRSFDHGYRYYTERRSELEQRFYSKPALKRNCKLHKMFWLAPSTQGTKRVVSLVCRHIASNHSEQNGLGALPIWMLFEKVINGFMELSNKFCLPLHDS